MNWKEQLDKAYGSFEFGEPISKPGYEAIKSFISTEIIEKLIAEIPEKLNGQHLTALKQRLSEDWL